MQLYYAQSEHLVSVTTVHIMWTPLLQFSRVLHQRLLEELKYDPGGGRMESTQKVRSRIKLSILPSERSL